MFEALDIIFYFTLFPLYLGAPKLFKKRVPLLSLSGIFLILNFIFIVIPGYFNYRGGVVYEETSTINLTAYILYFCQAIIAPFSIYAAWKMSGPPMLLIKERGNVRPLYFIILSTVAIYDILYVIFNVNEIPLLHIISGDFDVVSLYRSQLTHGFSESGASWYFSYYRIFTKDLIFLFLIPCFIFSKFWKSLTKLIFFVILMFMLLMHVEKAYLLYLFMGIYLAQSNFKPPSFRVIIFLSSAILFLSVLVTYIFFSDSFIEAINYLPIRLSAQTGYVVSQLELFNKYNFLGFEGIRLGFLGRLLSIEYVDISRLTFSAVHHDLASIGIIGSSAGSSMVELYMIVGYISPIVYFLMIYAIAQLDKNLHSFVVVNFKKNHDFNGQLAKSLYIYFVSFYSLAPVTSVFGVFSVATIFQPSLLIAIIIYSQFFRLRFRGSAFLVSGYEQRYSVN